MIMILGNGFNLTINLYELKDHLNIFGFDFSNICHWINFKDMMTADEFVDCIFAEVRGAKWHIPKPEPMPRHVGVKIL